MTALVSVVLSYAALASAAPGAGASANACTPNGGACEAQAPADEPAIYATPVEVNCPAATGSAATSERSALTLLSGDCGLPTFDFRYRVSRTPDSERPTGSVRPQRARRTARPIDTTSRLPTDPSGLLSSASGQPMAVYARVALTGPISERVPRASTHGAPTRTLEPLDRPPRA